MAIIKSRIVCRGFLVVFVVLIQNPEQDIHTTTMMGFQHLLVFRTDYDGCLETSPLPPPRKGSSLQTPLSGGSQRTLLYQPQLSLLQGTRAGYCQVLVCQSEYPRRQCTSTMSAPGDLCQAQPLKKKKKIKLNTNPCPAVAAHLSF